MDLPAIWLMCTLCFALLSRQPCVPLVAEDETGSPSSIISRCWVEPFVEMPWVQFQMEGAFVDKSWFMSEIVVPFNVPGYGPGYGGAHDLDIGAPPNYPVTALLPGKIASITDGKNDAGTAIWGRQVGVLLDQPYNGNP